MKIRENILWRLIVVIGASKALKIPKIKNMCTEAKHLFAYLCSYAENGKKTPEGIPVIPGLD
jgi:hypothetical protein